MKLLTRSFIIFIICLVLLIGAFVIFLSTRMDQFIIQQLEENVKHQADLLDIALQPLFNAKPDTALNSSIRRLASLTGHRITIIDSAGTVIADSDYDSRQMGNHLNRQEIINAGVYGWGKSIRHSQTLNIDFLYLAKRIEISRDGRGYIRLAVPISKINGLKQNLFWFIGGLSIVLFIMVGFISYFYSLILRKPLKEIAVFCRELKAGNFQTRLIKPVSGNIAELYNNLNSTAENLNQSFQTIFRERDMLNGILAALEDGVVVTDENGTVIMTNEVFNQLFPYNQAPVKKNIWELIHDARFLELFNLNKTDLTAKTREIHFADTGKMFRVSARYTSVFQGWIYTFRDITDAKNLETIKADFITNLSHELRTPLCAIKGYIETIDENDTDPKERTKYLKIIRENTDRLIAMVSDLLTLAEVEQPALAMDISEFDLNQLAGDIIVLFQKEAREKNLTLEFNPRPLPSFHGDRFMIQQLLINLLSNGLRFTEQGRIALDISYQDASFIIRVSDTGIGIPKDELPRIFERFYRIDKARSRSSGGTGLGLAIVKHSAQAHGGKVMVESQERKGSVFTVVLPQRNQS